MSTVEPYSPAPYTVTPSEVHADSFSEGDPYNNDSLDGYCALVFPDSMYPVKEKSITLGRDTRLQEFLERRTDLRISRIHPSHSPPSLQEYESWMTKMAASLASEDDDDEDDDFAPTEQRYASLEGGIATFDINLHDKAQHEETFLPIHPPGEEDGQFPRLGAISKRHLRLYLDEKDDCWTMEVLGRNGVFVDDEHFEPGQCVQLQHMGRIGVGDLNFKVIFENVQDSDLESLAPGLGDVDSSASTSDESETTPESEALAQNIRTAQGSSSEDESNEEPQKPITLVDAQASKNKPTTKLKIKVPPKLEKQPKDEKQTKTPMDKEKPPKKPKETTEETQRKIMNLLAPGEETGRRKGPGRPPANGLMSKREMKERQKALADAQKREKEGDAGVRLSPGIDAGAETEARWDTDKLKNKKRKRSDTLGDPKADATDRKRKQSPEKSPEPTEDQFTAEQLAPPGLTYVVIIYRILQEVAPEQLNLQQLYREMKKRYPYYRFRPKPGWESSVRHTVSAEHFIKGEKDGKGYKYTYNQDKPPAPQKQKQVTAPSNPTTYSGYGPAPPPGQFQPGSFQNTSYPNSYGGSNPANPYSQLPMPSQRPLANGATQPSANPPLQSASQQFPQARNPQNSPYPINPPLAMQTGQTNSQSTLSQQSAQPNLSANISMQSAAVLQPGASAPQASMQSTSSSYPAPPTVNAKQQQQQTQFTGAAKTPDVPNQSSPQPVQSAPSQATNSANRLTSTTQSANANAAQTPSVAAQQGQGLSRAPSQNAQSQPSSRPPSQPGVPTTPAAGLKTPFPPTPSEELAQGRFPRVLRDFEHNMRRLASNMPQKQQELEEKAINEAMEWIKANPNPNRDFRPSSYMGSYTVSIIANLISMVQKQDADILKTRQAQAHAQNRIQ